MAEDTKDIQKKPLNKSRWHRLRQVVQALFFILFIVLVWHTVWNHLSPVDHIFFHLDPLAGLTAMISGRSFLANMTIGLVITMVLTMVAGRAWCGWICPLGTVLDWVPSRKSKKNNPDIPSWWRQVKYGLLFIILVAALFGSLSLMFLDPITIMVRTFANGIIPGLTALVNGLESMVSGVDFLQPAVSAFNTSVRPWLLTDQPFLATGWIMLAVFTVVLALNAIRPRFWCRYLCPLGGLLGLISKISLFRVRSAEHECKSCGRCAAVCPTGAIDPEQQYGVKSSECVLCLDCIDSCTFSAFKFKQATETKNPHALDPSRRQFLFTLGAGIIGGLLVKTLPLINSIKTALIRPPGTTDEQLMAKCIRCGECVRVCPTGAIQPLSSVTNAEHLWTPHLEMRTGYCDYACNACGQVCPTGAITPLTLQAKRQTVIGKAVINTKRCIPYVVNSNCGVCEEMCPVPQKAIRFISKKVINSQGETFTLQQPQVTRGRCTGCGICETRCPVEGESAILIYSLNGGNEED